MGPGKRGTSRPQNYFFPGYPVRRPDYRHMPMMLKTFRRTGWVDFYPVRTPSYPVPVRPRGRGTAPRARCERGRVQYGRRPPIAKKGEGGGRPRTATHASRAERGGSGPEATAWPVHSVVVAGHAG